MDSRTTGIRAIGQVFPWDLADGPARARAIRDAGVTAVAIAASYHAVRTIRWTDDGAPVVVHHPRSEYYLRAESDEWTGRLRPDRSAVADDDTFARAASFAAQAGLGVQGWLVLTHDDEHLAVAHPDLATRDAWGNHSRFGFCPSQPEVAQYCRDLVAQTVRNTGITEYLVESVSAPGFRHSLGHDKISHSGLRPFDELVLLSLCFCPGCITAAHSDGWDPDDAAAGVRAAFGRRGLDAPTASLVGSALRTRARIATGLAHQLGEPVDGEVVQITVAATNDPAAFGAFAPLAREPGPAIGRCADLSSPDGAGWRELQAWTGQGRAPRAGTVQVGADSLATALRRSGMPDGGTLRNLDDLYLYHLGMRNPATLNSLDVHSVIGSPLQGEK